MSVYQMEAGLQSHPYTAMSPQYSATNCFETPMMSHQNHTGIVADQNFYAGQRPQPRGMEFQPTGLSHPDYYADNLPYYAVDRSTSSASSCSSCGTYSTSPPLPSSNFDQGQGNMAGNLSSCAAETLPNMDTDRAYQITSTDYSLPANYIKFEKSFAHENPTTLMNQNHDGVAVGDQNCFAENSAPLMNQRHISTMVADQNCFAGSMVTFNEMNTLNSQHSRNFFSPEVYQPTDGTAAAKCFATEEIPGNFTSFAGENLPNPVTMVTPQNSPKFSVNNTNCDNQQEQQPPVQNITSSPPAYVKSFVRPRKGKTPTPAHQKDEKYHLRRTKNNLAAKKSREERRARNEIIQTLVKMREQEHKALQKQKELELKNIFWLRQKLAARMPLMSAFEELEPIENAN